VGAGRKNGLNSIVKPAVLREVRKGMQALLTFIKLADLNISLQDGGRVMVDREKTTKNQGGRLMYSGAKKSEPRPDQIITRRKPGYSGKLGLRGGGKRQAGWRSNARFSEERLFAKAMGERKGKFGRGNVIAYFG